MNLGLLGMEISLQSMCLNSEECALPQAFEELHAYTLTYGESLWVVWSLVSMDGFLTMY